MLLIIMALQAPVLDQLQAHITILELSSVVYVNVDTGTSLQKNGIDAHAADYLLDIDREILEVDEILGEPNLY